MMRNYLINAEALPIGESVQCRNDER